MDMTITRRAAVVFTDVNMMQRRCYCFNGNRYFFLFDVGMVCVIHRLNSWMISFGDKMLQLIHGIAQITFKPVKRFQRHGHIGLHCIITSGMKYLSAPTIFFLLRWQMGKNGMR